MNKDEKEKMDGGPAEVEVPRQAITPAPGGASSKKSRFAKKDKKEKKEGKPQKKKHTVRNVVLIILGILVVAIGLFIYQSCRTTQDLMQPVDRFEALSKEDIENTVALSGTIQSKTSQQVPAPSSLEILTVEVEEGQQVTAGQVLATLDTTELEFQIRTAKVNIENAELTEEEAQKTNKNSARTSANTAKSAKEDYKAAQDNYQKQKEKVDAQQKALEDQEAEELLMEVDEKAQADEAERLAQQVAQAKLDLAAAQRAYDDLLEQDGNTSQVITARKDLEAAQRAYDDDMNGESAKFNIEKAKMDLDSAQQKLYDAQIQGDNSVTAARLSLEHAETATQTAKESAQKATPSDVDQYGYTESAAYQSALAQEDQARVSLSNAILNRDSNIATAQRNVESAQLAYDQTLENAEKSKLSSKDALDKAQANYDNALRSSSESVKTAADNLKKAEVNYKSALETQQDSLDSAKTNLEKTRLQYSSAQSNSSLASSQTVESAENGIVLQEISLERLEKQLEDAVIVAPISGTITSVNAKVGQIANGTMFVIEDTDNLQVEATVNEYEVGMLTNGQSARIQTDSTGDEVLPGAVVRISDAAQTGGSSSKVSFGVDIGLTEPNPRVKIGMNAQVVVIVEQKQQIYAVPYEAVIEREGKSYIWIKDETVVAPKGDKEAISGKREIEVTTGIETDTMIEIISPELHDGLEVVVGTSIPFEELMQQQMEDMGMTTVTVE